MKLEVYEGTIPGRTRSKYAAINSEILETLLRVKAGSSVRVDHPTYGLCNGLSANRKITLPLTRELGLEINRQRAAFKLAHEWEFSTRFTDGVRFLDNESVIARIESNCDSRTHFEAFQAEWIQEALRDCAEADYWYAHEKDCGREED